MTFRYIYETEPKKKVLETKLSMLLGILSLTGKNKQKEMMLT